jgi:transposase
MDETTLSLFPPLRACWMKCGQQKTISTPGQQRCHHLFGAYDWADDQVYTLPATHKNSESFIAFLEYLFVECHPDETGVLVLDNASYHKSNASLAALSLLEHRVLIVWLPPYCSTLNPIERYWLHLKNQVCVDTLYPSIDELVTCVELELSFQNDFEYLERFSFSK